MTANPTNHDVHIIGGGLAGSEAAWQLAQRGVKVRLSEMRGSGEMTPAHQTDGLAELVCSNSFRSDDHTTNAVGVIHEEMRRANGIIIRKPNPAYDDSIAPLFSSSTPWRAQPARLPSRAACQTGSKPLRHWASKASSRANHRRGPAERQKSTTVCTASITPVPDRSAARGRRRPATVQLKRPAPVWIPPRPPRPIAPRTSTAATSPGSIPPAR